MQVFFTDTWALVKHVQSDGLVIVIDLPPMTEHNSVSCEPVTLKTDLDD